LEKEGEFRPSATKGKGAWQGARGRAALGRRAKRNDEGRNSEGMNARGRGKGGASRGVEKSPESRSRKAAEGANYGKRGGEGREERKEDIVVSSIKKASREIRRRPREEEWGEKRMIRTR